MKAERQLLITGIILASGFSTRMKREKLLLEVGGRPLIERVIRAAKSSRLDTVILVYRDNRVMTLGKGYGVEVVYNASAHEGQSASLKLGVASSPEGTDGFMFILGDLPFLHSSTVDILLDAFKEDPRFIVAPAYNGKRGNPVLFPADLKGELLAIKGDKGGREILERMSHRVKLIPMGDDRAGMDIDTPQEYELVRGDSA